MKQKYPEWQNKEYFSPTMLNQYWDNPAEFNRLYIEKSVEKPPSIDLTYGSSIHNTLEYYFKNRIKRKYKQKEDLTRYFLKDFNKGVKELDFIKKAKTEKSQEKIKKKIEDLKDIGQMSLCHYWDKCGDLNPTYTEQELMYKVAGYPILNTVDLIFEETDDIFGNKTFVIEDTKTAKQVYDINYSMTSFQLRSYAMAVEENLGGKVNKVRYRILIKAKTPKIYVHTIRLEDNWKELFLRDVEYYIRAIKAGIFPRAYGNNYASYSSTYHLDWGDKSIFESVNYEKL